VIDRHDLAFISVDEHRAEPPAISAGRAPSRCVDDVPSNHLDAQYGDANGAGAGHRL
jgi:hypothetical protein